LKKDSVGAIPEVLHRSHWKGRNRHCGFHRIIEIDVWLRSILCCAAAVPWSLVLVVLIACQKLVAPQQFEIGQKVRLREQLAVMIEEIKIAALNLRRIVERIYKKAFRLKVVIIKPAILKGFADTYIFRKEVLIESLVNDVPRLLKVARRIEPSAERNVRNNVREEGIGSILGRIQERNTRIQVVAVDVACDVDIKRISGSNAPKERGCDIEAIVSCTSKSVTVYVACINAIE